MEHDLLLALTRIEGKLSVIDERLNGFTNTDHDHETRIRHLEGRPHVTPRALLLAAGTIAAVVGSLTPFLERLYS